MLENLTQRLGRVVKNLRGEARLTDANIDGALREVRMALLEADVALPVVKEFIGAVREKAVGQEVIGSLTPGQALVGVVQRELAALMGGAATPINFATTPPAVILLAGLQGAGKTTSAAKLARLLKKTSRRKCCWSVATSIVRPQSSNCRLSRARSVPNSFLLDAGEQPLAIAEAALDWARKHYRDVVIVDTAGRLAIDEAMMARDHAAARRDQTDRDLVRRRCNAGTGCGQHGQGFRRCTAADRRSY